MFFSLFKILFFQYNQVAYSLIDFGVLNDVEAMMIFKDNLVINVLVISHQKHSNFANANIQKIVDEIISVSKEGRDALFFAKSDQIRLSKTNKNELNKLKEQIESYIVLNRLFYDTYDKINSAIKDKKPYPEFTLNLSFFVNLLMIFQKTYL